jgi:hypothetical protein
VTASHDTYAISFAIAAPPPAMPQQPMLSSKPASCAINSSSSTHEKMSVSVSAGADSDKDNTTSAVRAPAMPAAPQPTGVAYVDPLWKAAYDAVSALQASLAKAATQDPLEYRRLVSAALLLAMRPWRMQTAAATAGSHVAAGGKAAAGGDELQKSAAELLEGAGQPDAAQTALHGSSSGGSKHITADPHHAAALLVRLIS